MTTSPSEKVDPGHWVSLCGAAMMVGVVALCSLALITPWWTNSKELPGEKYRTEATLWNRYTRVEMAADDSTLDCDKQCDITKAGSAKVRETNIPWADVCDKASGDLASTCQRLWVLRIFTLVCWFFALLYGVFSCFNFCGAGLPSSSRFPPTTKIYLGYVCVATCVLALCVAAVTQVRLEAKPPGTVPVKKDGEDKVVDLNGLGFLCVVASLFLSLGGIAMGYLSQTVLEHLVAAADVERGKPLADVNKGLSPDLGHQVGVHGGDEREEMKVLHMQPERKPLGSWMTDNK